MLLESITNKAQPAGAPDWAGHHAPTASSRSILPIVQEENLIDRLLADQSRLHTPVALFSRRHDQGLRTDLFRHLIPLEKPQPGEQYAFEVDLDKCSGCKACVSACHSLNGLDEGEAWRDVGLLLGEQGGLPHQQTVTTACHHCLEPACAEGCPVLAYEKDPVTGIVRHLDDQCIGCSYCILKCPYDVPKFSATRGIVRKCDMCHGRLSSGEAPACVQACPHEAIRIVTVSKEQVLTRSNTPLVSGAFDSAYTKPTTHYTWAGPPGAPYSPRNDQTGKTDRRALPADAFTLRLEEAHTPLALMLALTQFALGLSFTAWATGSTALWAPAFALACLGGAASVFHLGQPLKAWRVFLGFRRSWLSREVVAFGPWVGLLCGVTCLGLLDSDPHSLSFLSSVFDILPEGSVAQVRSTAEIAALLLGMVTILCSMMVYIDTRRPLWSAPYTGFRFSFTVFLGAAVGWACLNPQAALFAALAILLKLAIEAVILTHWSHQSPESAEARSAAITWQLLPRTTLLRASTALLAAALCFVQPILAAALLLVSEGAERRLFFQASPAPRMPGI